MASKKSWEYKAGKQSQTDQQEILDPEFDEIIGGDEALLPSQKNDYKTLEPQSGFKLGSFIGKGPKNYRRPDETILDEVVELLTRHPEIDASEVDVQIENGEVILTGVIPDEKMKFLASEVIKLIRGVKNVRNQLRLGSHLSGSFPANI